MKDEFLFESEPAIELPDKIVSADKLTPELVDEYILFLTKTSNNFTEVAKILLQWNKNKKEEIDMDKRFELDEKELDLIINKLAFNDNNRKKGD